MEESPYGEANSHSASREIPHLLWNPKIYYRVHKSPPLVLIMSKLKAVHFFLPYFCKIHPNIIFTPTPVPSAWSLPFTSLSSDN
jgi:hypothetical protein